MQTIAPQFEPAKRWAPCTVCKRWVTRAKRSDGASVVVERCSKGRGDIRLTDPLFAGEALLAETVTDGRYRTHACVPRAHSAANFERKSRNGMSDKKYSGFSGAKGGARR